MQFSPDKVTFGRHESFALRFGWLTKGFQALMDDINVFKSDEATVTLGVGKNMVNSIKYWLRACQICTWNQQKGFQFTQIGETIFGKGGRDPYLEDEATIWLIHWLLTSNPEIATAWYWFFNHFHKPEFTSKEVVSSITDFCNENVSTRYSVTSIKHDVNVLLRMYIQSKDNSKTPVEETLDSPLSLLKLMTFSPMTKTYTSKLSTRENLPVGIFGYAISDFFYKRNISEIPIEDLMYSRKHNVTPGSVFRLSENELLTKLEQLINYIPENYTIDETAGIHQLYRLREVLPIDYIEQHYQDYTQGSAILVFIIF